MQIHLDQAIQKSRYHYAGAIELCELAEVFKGYAFEEETLEKAAIHKRNMEQGILPFHVTLRIGEDSSKTEGKEGLTFAFQECELRDGKSKAAAICQMDPEKLKEIVAELDLFLVSKETMDKLEQNQL